MGSWYVGGARTPPTLEFGKLGNWEVAKVELSRFLSPASRGVGNWGRANCRKSEVREVWKSNHPIPRRREFGQFGKSGRRAFRIPRLGELGEMGKRTFLDSAPSWNGGFRRAGEVGSRKVGRLRKLEFPEVPRPPSWEVGKLRLQNFPKSGGRLGRELGELDFLT